VIADVKVTLGSEHTATISSATSQRGAYRFGELPIGSFILKFEKPGYQTVIAEVVTVRMAAALNGDPYLIQLKKPALLNYSLMHAVHYFCTAPIVRIIEI